MRPLTGVEGEGDKQGDSDADEAGLFRLFSSDNDSDLISPKVRGVGHGGRSRRIETTTTTTEERKGTRWYREHWLMPRKVNHKADRILSVHEIDAAQRQLSSRLPMWIRPRPAQRQMLALDITSAASAATGQIAQCENALLALRNLICLSPLRCS
jgi:hypothetical protein